MFRAVIIEDEKPILELMKVILGRNTNYTIVGAFTNPIEALEKMEDIKPDVAFIDVEMPKMNGLELARKVRALTIQTEIVFTTAYKNYALDAFGVEAIDYILKPVTPSTIERVTERLVNRQRATTMVIPQKDLFMIQCFGGFEVRNSEGVPVHFRTRRAEELFAYFLCHSGRNISKWQVMDLLWPDMPEERSSSNLYNTIYLMKKILKENELGMSIRKMNDGYMMETGNQMYDALAFQRSNVSFAEGKLDREQMEYLCALYRGPLLDGKTYLWKIPLEEAYFKQYSTMTKKLVEDDLLSNDWNQAEHRLDKYLAVYPLHEEMNQLMIDIYERQGNREKMLRLYTKYERVSREELGIEPSLDMKSRLSSF
ncbi:response regulator [Paenibacillus sp. 2TAB26]|uniref:response regulator n=1 Tax=Paenibacillus sp. 2TAB26 TaxID=3233005 RepID=UPI003F9DF0C0